MKKFLPILFSFFVIHGSVIAQNYKLVFESPTGFRAIFPDIGDIDQIRGLDMEGDDVLEIRSNGLYAPR